MNIQFNINYKANLGEMMSIEYFLHHQPENKLTLNLYTLDGVNWTGKLALTTGQIVCYKYNVLKDNEILLEEWGKPRVLTCSEQVLVVRDSWRPREQVNNTFLTSAFTKAIFKRKSRKANNKIDKPTNDLHSISFKLQSATIEPSLSYGITGNIPELGAWKKPLLLDDNNFPEWTSTIFVSTAHQYIEYKYVIIDSETKETLIWEEGDNRIVYLSVANGQSCDFCIHDDGFRQVSMWRGAGVAVPVFSLRSQSGMGIGAFTDLKILTDWSHKIGLKVIQLLPVNDTIAQKNWRDSYPYAAISVFALHPLYVNLNDIAPFKDKTIQAAYNADAALLNASSEIDFEQVLHKKLYYLRLLFDQEYEQFKKDKQAQAFLKESSDWLPQYAAFCHLRDKYKTVNFTQWPEYKNWSETVKNTINSTDYERCKDVEFYYFVQFHADRQLQAMRDYARSKGVVLKGDLPIGIFRYSCDAWVAPDLYNMHGQAGAPPDDFAVLGQNWGFPTYNWDKMAKDHFGWWRNRMQRLNRYFDALRLDHILGFFRIWEIPTDQIQATMGLFNPRLPLTADEIEHYGISGDLTKYTQPYLTDDRMRRAFGSDMDLVVKTFFVRKKQVPLAFKPAFKTQTAIRDYIQKFDIFEKYETVLLEMRSDVLLIMEEGTKVPMYNPRITLASTYAFSQLDTDTKTKFEKLYHDYFFVRHDTYWEKQALQKLPTITDAGEMLICGEDLGMIPQSVSGVMKAMNILSLEIQRMPKGDTEFGVVQHYPYMAVCSPSSHDMSTIRGWWESDAEMAGRFFHNYLHWFGVPAKDCTPDIVKTVVDDHLSSPAMLAIFPIQDLIGMDGHLRNPYAGAEQINDPANPDQSWNFRFHIPVEQLLTMDSFNDMLKAMLKVHGR